MKSSESQSHKSSGQTGDDYGLLSAGKDEESNSSSGRLILEKGRTQGDLITTFQYL